MATLRLFANLREAAGASTVQVEGATVAEVIGTATAEYGERFAKGLPTAKVWVNGDPADDTTTVGADDEIALIPPVSGGTTAVPGTGQLLQAWPVTALIVAVAVANFLNEQWFAFVLVGVGIAWLWDHHDVLATRRITTNLIPQAIAVAAAVNATYSWGLDGYAASLALGALVILTWAVLDRRVRSLDSVAVALLIGGIAALGTGGLMFVRLRGESEVAVYLALVAASGTAGWLAQRFAPDMAGVDPNLAALAVVLLGGVVVAFTTDVFTKPVAILAAVLIGGGMLAGKALGSIVRWGPVVHTERAPGMLTMFDGPMVAAAAFFVIGAIFA
jgi:molybdopterin converting factor small subunit